VRLIESKGIITAREGNLVFIFFHINLRAVKDYRAQPEITRNEVFDIHFGEFSF